MSLTTVFLGQFVALDGAKKNTLIFALECCFAFMRYMDFFSLYKSTIEIKAG
jgi:hypothetical protein